MTRFCNPCQLNFTHVLKVDSLEDEEGKMLEELKWTKLVKRQRHNDRRPKNISQDELTKIYFDQLSHSDILKLYLLYEYDFKNFHYTFEYHKVKFPLNL